MSDAPESGWATATRSPPASGRRRPGRFPRLPAAAKDIPNLLTFGRLLLVPVFVVLMTDPSETSLKLAIVVFVSAALTDLFDGFLARRYGAVSDLGKLLDPLADKLLVTAALVMLVAQRSDMYARPWVPAPLVVLSLSRELWVTGLRGLAASRGVMVAAGDSGKVKSVLQMVSVVLLLLNEAAFALGPYMVPARLLGTVLLAVSLVFSVWGAVGYTSYVFSSCLGGDDADHSPRDGASPECPPGRS